MNRLITFLLLGLLAHSLLAQPSNPFPVPEYDPAEAVIIRYPFNSNIWPLYEQLIMESQEAVHTVLLVNNNTERTQLQSLLQNAGIPTDNISLLTIPASRMWVRDHGPLAIDTDQGKAFINFLDYNNSGFHDQNLPISLANHWGYQHYSLDWILDGGNYMVDSYGTLFTTNRLYTNNPSLTPEAIDQMLYEYMGITNIVTVSAQHDDYWGHIDMQIKLLNDTTMVISSVSPGHPNYEYLEGNVAIMEALTAPNGNPYHIERLPKADNWKTYANSIILNDKVIVPIYNHANDETALNTYSELMPDHTVVGINSNSIIHWGGAIHCITMQIFAGDPVWYELALETEAAGEIMVNGSPYTEPMEIEQGAELHLEAIPHEGFVFSYWAGDLSSDTNPIAIEMSSDMNIKAVFSRSQEYFMSFHPEKITAFEYGTYGLLFSRITEQQPTEGGMVYYFAPHVESVGEFCFDPQGRPFTGEKVMVLNNGYDVFFNQNNDSIKIRVLAAENDSWPAWSNGEKTVMAEVTSIENESFLGITDVVKTITFSMYNAGNEPISHPINNKSIKISQQHGMVKAFNFINFPDLTTGEEQGVWELNASGLSEPLAGATPFYHKEVLDFYPGDELHVVEVEEHFADIKSEEGHHKETQTILRFLEKTEDEESVTYTKERLTKTETTTFPQKETTTTFSHDTVTVVFGPDTMFDHYPGEPFPLNSNQVTMHYQGFNQEMETDAKTLNYRVFNDQGDCFLETIPEGCMSLQTYYRGLGGPYYDCSTHEKLLERKPVYFARAEETWGSPLTILPVAAQIPASESEVSLYPNPARGFIKVIIPDSHKGSVLEIFDIAGREIYQTQVWHIKTRLELGFLERGIYFFRMREGERMITTGKLVLH